MELIPTRITDLADRETLTRTELAYREIIDSICVTPASDLTDFVQLWNGLEINLDDDISFQLCAGEIIDLPFEFNDKKTSICNLSILRGKEKLLNLKFITRNSAPNCLSPLVLSNTRVKPNLELIETFNPYQFYDSLIYLLHKLVPSETELSIFVRQRDTLSALQQGDNVTTTPLYKIFTRAGWNLGEHITKAGSRKHPHILNFINT